MNKNLLVVISINHGRWKNTVQEPVACVSVSRQSHVYFCVLQSYSTYG